MNAKGGMPLSRSKVIETVLKAVSMLITAALAVIKALGLLDKLAELQA